MCYSILLHFSIHSTITSFGACIQNLSVKLTVASFHLSFATLSNNQGVPTAATPTVANAGISQGFVAAIPKVKAVADLAWPIAVECRNTEAWSVLHRPVLHQTAMHSELLLIMWYGGNISSPCSKINYKRSTRKLWCIMTNKETTKRAPYLLSS